MNNDINLQINSKEDRELLKNKGVEIREAGDLKTASEIFTKVVEWDLANNNLKGAMDVLGHLSITWKLLAEKESNPEVKKFNLNSALAYMEQAVTIGQSNPEQFKGQLAIQKIHKANFIKDYAEFWGPEKDSKLEEALKTVDDAMINFPGSPAHKAWASNAKAQILLAQNKLREAQEVISQGEVFIDKGMEEEITTNPERGEQNIDVWRTGLAITRAQVYLKEGKIETAKQQLDWVIIEGEHKKHLSMRKEQAEKILKGIA